MPSTYTPNKQLELQATGENAGTWGTLLNAVLSIIDLNLGGRLALNVAGSSNVTLTSTQERNAYILMTGVLTGNIDLVFTATNGGFYLLDNRSTGAFTITAKPSGGTGVVIPQNAKCLIMIDPDNTRAVIMDTPNMLTTQGDILYRDVNGTQRLAAGTSGQFLKTLGAGANPVWANVSGANQASFLANKNGVNQNISTTATTQITFGTEVFDIGGFFASNAWTPPAGTISIDATVALTGVLAERFDLYLYKNGAIYKAMTQIAQAGGTLTMSISISSEQCNGSDVYTIFIASTTDTSYSVVGTTVATWFSGTLV